MEKKITPSTENVKCNFCNIVLSKKNLLRHTDKKHKGKLTQSSIILSRGQTKLIPGQAKAMTNDTKDTKLAANTINSNLAELEDTLVKVTLNSDDDISSDMPREGVCSDVNNKDKVGTVSSNNKFSTDCGNILDPEDNGSSLIEEISNDFREIFSEFKNFVTDMMGNSIKNKSIIYKKEIFEKSKNDMPESLETNLVPNCSKISMCKDVQQLLEILPEQGFNFCEEQNLVMCVLCNQSVNPNVRPRDKMVGIFTFDLSKYVSDMEKDPSKQPRNFINLKSRLVTHEQESQIHLGLKEKNIFREERV